VYPRAVGVGGSRTIGVSPRRCLAGRATFLTYVGVNVVFSFFFCCGVCSVVFTVFLMAFRCIPSRLFRGWRHDELPDHDTDIGGALSGVVLCRVPDLETVGLGLRRC